MSVKGIAEKYTRIRIWIVCGWYSILSLCTAAVISTSEILPNEMEEPIERIYYIFRRDCFRGVVIGTAVHSIGVSIGKSR